MTFSGGNIGIGVGSPDSKLTVYGNLKVLFTANPYDRNAASIVDLGISGITGASNWALRGTYQYGNGVSYNSVGGDLDLIKSMDGNTILGTKKDGTALGYVGIGTTSPGTTLAVKGSISKETITGIDNTWDNFIKY